jgi:hypothetical protein
MRSAAALATATVLCEPVKNYRSPPSAAAAVDVRPQGAGDGRDRQDHQDSEAADSVHDSVHGYCQRGHQPQKRT